MAEETQNPATQVSSGISSMLSGIWQALAASESSWRGLIGLTLVLVFVLIYSGKLTPQTIPTPVKQDNAELLSSVSKVGTECASLKAQLASSVGELSEKMETIKAPPVPPVKVQRVKRIQASTGDPKGP